MASLTHSPELVEGLNAMPAQPSRSIVFSGSCPPTEGEIIHNLRQKYSYALPHIEFVREGDMVKDYKMHDRPRIVVPNLLWTIGSNMFGCCVGA